MSEEQDVSKKEMMEFAKAAGYVAGEVLDVAKGGLSIGDLKSIKDLWNNKDMIKKGMEIPGDLKTHVMNNLTLEDAADILVAMKEGFELGLE